MIIEIAPELLLSILAPGNEIHAKIEQGVTPGDYRVAGVALNERGNIALALQHRNDEVVNPAPYSVTVTSLDCRAQLSKLESFEAFMRAYDEWIGDVLAQPYAEPGVMLDKRIRLKAVVDRARAALSDE